MATASYASGPVMVQEPVAAPAPVVDLTSGETADIPERPANMQSTATASVASQKDEDDDSDNWDTASFYEDILDEAEGFDYSLADGRDSYTADEARALRQHLRKVGASQFILETITLGKVTARKLLTAFGVPVPEYMVGPDTRFYKLLGMAINRELNKRLRIEKYKTIDDAVQLLQTRRNIVVITGAGISTSLGIPDFRSKKSGFYTKLREMGFEEPESVFDLHNFDDDPNIFYKLAGDILPDLNRWSPTHQFIRLLQDKGKLLTCYTQNIDNIEETVGISKGNLIQCHGSWATATCRKCKFRIPGDQLFPAVREKKPMECRQCLKEIANQKPGMKRKRSSNGNKKKRAPGDDDSDSDGAYDIPQPGIMKPDITFFGEPLPDDFFRRLKDHDRDKVDLVIVIGTSMKVAPVSEVPNFLPADVPQMYISLDPIRHINFDINLLGECDTVVAELARRAGWDLTHEMVPKDLQVDVAPVDEEDHVYSVRRRRTEPLAST